MDLDRIQRISMGVGIVAIGLGVLTAFFGLERFLENYLYAFFFWFGLSMGCLILLMVQYLAGGSWGVMLSRPLLFGAKNLNYMALLFIPVLLGMGQLYPWMDADVVSHSPMLENKTGWLNWWFFSLRAIIFFGIWLFYVRLFDRAAKTQEEKGDPNVSIQMARVSGLGVVLFVLSMTFAAFDWGMSLEPEWFSGMYGVIFMIGQAISAMAFMVIVTSYLATKDETMNETLTPKRLQDMGNFLLGFTVFWAYVSMSQVIIIWSGNVIETNPWYVLRFNDNWRWVAIVLIVFHFAMPFAILLSRWVKRKRRALVIFAFWMLLMRLVDLFWILVPAFGRETFPLNIFDLAPLIGLGGLWLAWYIGHMKGQTLITRHDPRLAPAEAHHA